MEEGPIYVIISFIIAFIGFIIIYIDIIDISTSFKNYIKFLIIVIFYIFLLLVIPMIFTLERRVRIEVRYHYEDEEIIIYLNNKIKEWLNKIIILFGDMENKHIHYCKYSTNQLEKIEKDLLLKGRFLEALVDETSNFLEINKESIEHLIGFKIGVNKHIIKNIVYDCKNITIYDEIIGNPRAYDKTYYEKKRKELNDDLINKINTIKEQINWNNQLSKHKKDIKTLIKIVKEESTGNAIGLLVDLLKNAGESEQLKFLIRAADARAGYKLGELLGFKLRKESFTWYDMPVDNNLAKIKKYLEEFEILRDISIEQLTENFMNSISNDPLFCFDEILYETKERLKFDKILSETNNLLKWIKDAKLEKTSDEIKSSKNDISFSLKINEQKNGATLNINNNVVKTFIVRNENGKLNIYNDKTIKIDYDHPISIALTYGYSNVLSKVFRKIIERAEIENRYLFSWNEIPGNDNDRLIDFLKQKYGIDWVRTAKIEKMDDGKTIRVSFEQNYLSLSLNIEKTKMSLKIDDGRANEFIMKMESGKLNIYENRLPELHIILIKSEGFKTQTRREGKIPLRGEQQLKDELVSFSTDKSLGDRCNIFPIDMIKERGIESQISKIFVGIESINISGNVVHPRGETNIIKHMHEKNANVEVFAFGETYKVQNFDEYHIDYSKLSLLDGKYIDYIITDHDFHKRPDEGWKSLLDCCRVHWRKKI